MNKLPALIVRKDTIKKDHALAASARGDRKLLVTKLWLKEQAATSTEWHPPATNDEKCPVQVMTDTELAVFTQTAKQDRHYHAIGTEIYMVMEGNMQIWVSGPDRVGGQDHVLECGDMIIINPGTIHEVRTASVFLCRVVTVNCQGDGDRHEVQCPPGAPR